MFFLILMSAIVFLLVLYLLAIMPRMTHKPDMTPLQGVLYAHRGLHDNESEAPENSMTAFRKAVDAGYGIELDLQLSKDKKVIIFHDATLDRVCGVHGKAEDYTYEELQEFRLCGTEQRIPLFEDFLKMVDGQVPLIVELKVEWQDVGVCSAADQLLREYQGVYCIESFNPLALIWYKRNHREVVRGQLADKFTRTPEFKGALYGLLENLLLNRITQPDFVAYNHQYARSLSRRLCRKLYGNMAVAWTIKSEEELASAEKSFDLFIFDSFIPAKSESR